MNTTILAVDHGKFNSVLVWDEPENQATIFRVIKATPGQAKVGGLFDQVRTRLEKQLHRRARELESRIRLLTE